MAPFMQLAQSPCPENIHASMNRNVLLIGLSPDSVDYGKWPQLSPATLEAALSNVIAELSAEGYEAVWCLTDQGETAGAVVEEALKLCAPDVVVVGAGVRTDPDLLVLFEVVVNLVHKHAPQEKIAFNQSPYDTVDAVKRWSRPVLGD